MADALGLLRDALTAKGCQPRTVRPGQLRAKCPTHDDQRPSLVATMDGGRVLLRCFAGCRVSAVVAALGLRFADLFEGPRQARGKPAVVARYAYEDAEGQLVATKVRFNPKGFAWRTPAGDGERSGLYGAKPGLYRLSTLVGAHRVAVCEGEKAAEAIASLGLAATCGWAGVNSPIDRLADALHAVANGAEVLLLPDHDAPGAVYADRWARALTTRGHVVRVLALPDLPARGDAADWTVAGGTREAFEHLVAETPAWTPDAKARAQHARRLEAQRSRRALARAARGVPPDASPANAATTALAAVEEALWARDARTGRQIKVALAGRVARDTVEAALRAGVEQGLLIAEPGPRRARCYRVAADIREPHAPPDTDDPLTYTGFLRPGHPQASPDTRAGDHASDFRVSECPEAVKPEAVCERSSLTLQRPIPLAIRHTQASGTPDTQRASGARTLNLRRGGGRTEVRMEPTIGAPSAEARCGWADPYRPLDPLANRVDFYDPIYVRGDGAAPGSGETPIARAATCCGRPGSQLRCQLCRHSPTYLECLRTPAKPETRTLEELQDAAAAIRLPDEEDSRHAEHQTRI